MVSKPELNLEIQDTSQELADPQNAADVYYGSIGSILRQNLGQFVICEFLIGTERLDRREGVLYNAGNNFITLENDKDAAKTYTVCDIYSLKFVTFFDVKKENE